MMLSRQDPKATIIIPVFNNRDTLQYCLSSFSNSHFRDFEVIVVDDCSTDNSLEVTKKFDCQVIRLNRHSGPAIARNKGAEIAKGYFLIFLDSDVVCEPETLGQLIKPLQEGADACVGMYTPIPSFRNFFSMYKNIFIYHYHDMASDRIDWFWTACGAIKKEVFFKLNGFSKSFAWKSVEDIDLGYRMTKNNYRIFLNKNALVEHLHHFYLKDILINDFKKGRDWTYFNLKSNQQFVLKHPLAQFKFRGLGLLLSLMFIFTLILSTIKINFLAMAVIIFFTALFIERRLFFSFFRYGGTKAFTLSMLLKPLDDLVVSIGAFTGAVLFLLNRELN